MGFVYGLISILFLVYLVLRIVKMLTQKPAAPKRPASPINWNFKNDPSPDSKFDPNRFNTAALPKRSSEEIKRQYDSMPSEWITYNGLTPPLRLKVRGQSYESFRRVARKYIDLVGQATFERYSDAQKAEVNNHIIAEAYVTDWEGPQYPDGNPMLYTPANLVILMSKDEHLLPHVTSEAQRISPAWPSR
jgi:hypothetical protein